MAWREVNPAELEGDALRRWYLRSSEEIERRRQAKAGAEHVAFFGNPPQSPQKAHAAPGRAGARLAGTDVEPGFAWRPVGPGRWRREEVSDPEHGWRPVPLPSPVLGREDEWSRPVPPPSIPPPPGGSRPVPLAPIYPLTSTSAGDHRTPAQPVRSVSYRPDQPAAPGRASEQGAAARPQRHGIWIAGRQPGELDPSRTDVFRPGPDGKLQPVPGWRTTGPFEFGAWSRMFDWGGVAGDLTDITTGALDFMAGGGLAGQVVKGLGYKIGPDVVRGIIHGHHAWPKFMGGPSKQELARLYQSLHVDFHVNLEAALKQAGFLRVGGRGGGTANWAEYFRLNPAREEEALEILQRVTREFDTKNGTKVSNYLDGSLAKRKARTPPPPQ